MPTRAALGRSLLPAIVALLLLPSPARAQLLIGYLLGEKLTTPTLSFGFELGLNLSTLDGLDGASGITKPVFGLFADWRFSEHFHLGGSVLPISSRGAEGITPLPTGDPEIDAQTAGGTMARSLSYIDIPVLLRWAPKRETGVRLGLGPAIGIITSANDRYEAITSSGTPYVLERDIGGEVPGLDLGVAFDVEYRFHMISLGARYKHGLTDLRQEGTPDAVRTRTWTGTGRIYLGRKRAEAPTTEVAPAE